MASSQGDWIDTALTASTLTSCRIQWQVCLGQLLRSWNWVDYNDVDNKSIESAYASDRRPVSLENDGATRTVDFDLMVQITDERKTQRKIRRIVVVS